MSKILIICGPTATGKTNLAINLARKFKGEIISADSRQVFRGMDVGTGKDLPKNSEFRIMNNELGLGNKKYTVGYHFLNRVPVWLYDVVKPDYRFSVGDYIDYAWVVIKDIWRRSRLPIVVGGTGFYIHGLIDGLGSLGIPPDWELREKLSNYSIAGLSNYLKKINPGKWQAMNNSDKQNPRRLVRAIEVASIKNKELRIKNQEYKLKLKTDKALMIGLRAANKILYQRIDRRVDKRIRQGIVREIIKLLKRNYNWNNSVLGNTIGYREWQPFFEKKTEREKIVQQWKFAEHGYARRQLTWFKKDKRIKWFDITKKNWGKIVEKKVGEWYTNQRYA